MVLVVSVSIVGTVITIVLVWLIDGTITRLTVRLP
jgi:hypothetical protein